MIESKTLLVASTGLSLKALNLSLTSAITSDLPISLGSMIKFLPFSQLGGKDPVVIYLRASIMVYLLQDILFFLSHFCPR